MESTVENGGAKAVGLISASMSQISFILGSCKIKPAVNSVEVPPHPADLDKCSCSFMQKLSSCQISFIKQPPKLGTCCKNKLAEISGQTPLLQWLKHGTVA